MEERYQEREEAQQLADMQELQSQLPDVELPEDAETEEPLFPDQQAMTNELPAQEDSEISEPIQVVNFHITDDALGRGTAKEKFRANIMACLLYTSGKLKILAEFEGRSINGEVLYLIRQAIAQHEKDHGTLNK